MELETVGVAEFVRRFRSVHDEPFTREDVKTIKKGRCANLDVVASLLPKSIAVVSQNVFSRDEYDADDELVAREILLVCPVRGRLIGSQLKREEF